MNNAASTLEAVKDYYGKTLKSNGDLKTNACCSYESIPTNHKKVLELIDDEILNRFYGCGSPLPPELEGCTVLDLGCGTGRDAFMTSYLVGEKGFVIGVDMTDEQLEVGRSHIPSQMKRFGFSRENVAFKKGYIEDLAAIEIEDNSIDIVISNCVLNLSPDKKRVFSEIFRVLKPGGELYFSDVFSGRRVPENLRTDPVLYGECLGGALYIEDFRRLLVDLGCPDFRVVAEKPIGITNHAIENRAGMIDFYSMTVRAFKLPGLEDICENYGQVAIYNGTIEDAPHSFTLDNHHIFKTGQPMLICGNTASMLQNTRFATHFRVIGDRSVHYGPFDCSGGNTDSASADDTGSTSCC